MTDLTKLSALELRSGIARKDLSPVELLAETRRRVEALNPTLNAFVEMCWDRAEDEARAAERRQMQGEDLPPLFGLPLGVKESTDVEDLHTTMGSRLYAGNRKAKDAATVGFLRRAGAVVVGKTNIPELTQGGTTRNPLYGLTRNAHDGTRSCLGSSGGSAVALSADMVTIATGSDMGGSIRGPAAANGTVGLRPSPGLVPREGAALGFDGSTVVGPMARNVPDLMLLLAGMVGPEPLDPLSWALDTERLVRPKAADASTLRIAVSADLGCIDVAQSIRDRFAEVVDALGPRVGAVEWITPDLGEAVRSFYMLRPLSYLIAYGAVHETAPDTLTPQKNVDLRRGHAIDAAMIAEAMRDQTLAYRALAGLLQEWDVLITPGASQPLPTLDEVDRKEAELRADNARFGPREYDFESLPTPNLNTPLTWTAHPVATITAGRGGDGLPFGVNLVGRHRGDVRLLETAMALEGVLAAIPGFERPLPDLSAHNL